MISLTVANLWAYKRRLIGTLVAIVIGVAFLSGTLLLGDTLRTNFDNLYQHAYGGTDVVVRSATKISSDQRQNTRGSIDANTLDIVRALPGVAVAQPYLEGYGRLLGHDGKGIGGDGPPTRAANWVTVPSLNPYRLVSGRAPRANDEVVINRGAARSGSVRIGDMVTLLTPAPLRVRVVGVATFGSADGFGSTTFTGLTLDTARRHLTNDPGQLSEVLVKAAPGVSNDTLAIQLRRALPPGVQAITGAQLAGENIRELNNGFLAFVRGALLVFSILALLVAALSINNAFTILRAQRSRDTALVRAVGATRGQVLTATLMETLAVAAIGSAAGWVAGVGIAALLKSVFSGFGFALPTGGLVLRPSSAVIAVFGGLVATAIGGLLPALRASRIPPVAALRDLTSEAVGPARRRAYLAAASTAIGVALIVFAAAGTGGFASAALGGLFTLVGVVGLGPAAARPAATLLGAPLAAGRGATGGLARQNAMRNPRRTAATAAALMIGVSVVTLFAVVGASLEASAAGGVDRSLRADLSINSAGLGGVYGGGRFSPQLATDIARLPAVRLAVGVAAGSALLNGTSHPVVIADPAAIPEVLDLGATSGNVRALDARTIAVAKAAADAHHWHVGTPVSVTYPDGTTDRVTVAGVYSRTNIVGSYLLHPAAWAAHDPQPVDEQVLVALRSGADLRATRAAIETVGQRYGSPQVQDRAEYRSTAAGGVNTLLAVVYVMLVLAIVIALLGIANTISMSVNERRRELALLRALGQTRRQVRTMVLGESVIVSVFGTLGGLVVGIVVGWALVGASSSSALDTFSAPAQQLVVFLVIGALAGVVAALRPARRATRLSIVEALAQE